MAEALIITMLSSKRAELSGAILELQSTIERRKADLAHLDATIRLFDPSVIPATIKPRGCGRPSAFFDAGELTGFIFDVLREAPGPVSSRELTDRLIQRKELPNDAQTRRAVQACVRKTLGTQRRRGVLECVGEGLGSRWRVVNL